MTPIYCWSNQRERRRWGRKGCNRTREPNENHSRKERKRVKFKEKGVPLDWIECNNKNSPGLIVAAAHSLERRQRRVSIERIHSLCLYLFMLKEKGRRKIKGKKAEHKRKTQHKKTRGRMYLWEESERDTNGQSEGQWTEWKSKRNKVLVDRQD